MKLALTKEAVKTMFHMWTNKNEDEFIPILQILKLNQLPNVYGRPTKWKVVISDGVYLMTGVCSETLSPQFESGAIQEGTIVRLSRFNIETLQNEFTKICIIYDVTIVCNSNETVGKGHRDVNFIWKRED